MASERTQRRIDSLLDEAEEAIAQLDWQVVQARAQAVLALDPDNPEPLTTWPLLNVHLERPLARFLRNLGPRPRFTSHRPRLPLQKPRKRNAAS